MKLFIILSLLTSGPAYALNEVDAIHLLRRTGFSVDPAEVKKLRKLDRLQAANLILSHTRSSAKTAEPIWLSEYRYLTEMAKKVRRGELNKKKKKLLLGRVQRFLGQFPGVPKKLQKNITETLQGSKRPGMAFNMLNNRVVAPALQAWWIQEMIETDSPLTERMTLFWHGHFVSSFRKVNSALFMFEQNAKLRQNALGSFSRMLFDLSKDAAMLQYLDGNKNRKAAPNENFAREVMELFTLGEGHYTEKDIKEAARAFTGWNFDRETGLFQVRWKQHDDAEKTVFGQTGSFDGDDVLKLILAKRQTAKSIAKKIWREFVAQEISPEKIESLADLFFTSGYEIKTLLREILVSDEFYNSRGQIIKSPVDLVVGTLKQFRLETDNYLPFALVLEQLGQELFSPPSVKGWPGGQSWINTAHLVNRKNFLNRVFRVGQKKEKPMMAMNMRNMMDVQLDSNAWIDEVLSGSKDKAEKVLLAVPAVGKIEKRKRPILFLKSIALDPAFQVR